MKKLSASTIKYLLDNEYKFVNKFALGIDVEPVNKHFAIGGALHKIAEHYSITGEFSIDEGFLNFSQFLDDNTIKDEKGNDIMPMSDEEIEEIVLTIESAALNLRETLIPGGNPEVRIDTDDFVGYIDNLKDGWIMDYKFVGKFNSKGMFDSIPGYLIQMAIYSLWYIEQYGERPSGCAIIEIIKGDTLIGDPQYIKKDYLIDLIRKQNPYEDINEKLTKEKLVELYKPREKPFQWIKFVIDDEFIQFGHDVLTTAIELRGLVVEFKEELDSDKRKEINNKVKLNIKKFKAIVIQFVEKYYSSLPK